MGPFLTIVDLSGNKLLWICKKTLDVANEDVLKDFDNVWCVKSLIGTRSNLVINWENRPRLGAIS